MSPPLPVLAYNPVIDGITVEKDGLSSTDTWLLDTGASVSMISVAQGMALGLVDPSGDPLGEADFYLPLGGIGGAVDVPGFIVDNLIVPTMNGYNLVFNDARVVVHDIGYYDIARDEYVILGGIFGSNFLCATMDMAEWEIYDTAFQYAVIDFVEGTIGFDVKAIYPLPSGTATPLGDRDFNRDGVVDLLDLKVLAEKWLDECDLMDWHCAGTDVYRDDKIDLKDYSIFSR